MSCSKTGYIKYADNKRFKKFLDGVISKADEGLNVELIKWEDASCGEGQHGNFYSASLPFKDFIAYLCFAYKYTEDEKYLKKIKGLMLHYSAYEKWNGKCWGHSELNNAHFCRAMAIGFYSIKNSLSFEECKLIAKSTLKNGIMPILEDWVLKGHRIHALDTMGHNWWLVCVASAGAALVAMREFIDNAEELIENAVNACERWFAYKGNLINSKPPTFADGAFYESVSYLDFALQDYYIFKYLYENTYGRKIFDDDTYINGFAEFFIHTLIPMTNGNEFVLFGDTSIMKIMRSVIWMIGMDVNNPELIWYVNQWEEREPDVLDVFFFEKVHLGNEKIPDETSKIYPQIGWAIMRNSFKKDSAILAVKCGDTWNHAHADAGSFVFYNHGDSVIYDSGGCAYALPEYVNYYFTSQAHNVVLFNGKGQDERDRLDHARMRGKVSELRDYDNVKYVLADATGPMSRYFRHHLRHFVWLDNFVLIYDDIEAYEPGEVDFLLHMDEKFESEFEMLTPSVVEKNIGKKHKQPENEAVYRKFKIQTDADGRCKIVSIIKLATDLEITYTEENEIIQISDGTWNVSINALSDGRIMHNNCIVQTNKFTTDAVLVAQKENSYFIVNGSILRKDEKIIYDELERNTILVR